MSKCATKSFNNISPLRSFMSWWFLIIIHYYLLALKSCFLYYSSLHQIYYFFSGFVFLLVTLFVFIEPQSQITESLAIALNTLLCKIYYFIFFLVFFPYHDGCTIRMKEWSSGVRGSANILSLKSVFHCGVSELRAFWVLKTRISTLPEYLI